MYGTGKDLHLLDQAVIAAPNSFPNVDAFKHFKCDKIKGAGYFNQLFFNIVSWYQSYKDLEKKI